MVGHLLAWEMHERDGSWHAWVSWIQQAGGRHVHKVVDVRAGSLQPLEHPDAYSAVPRRVRGRDGLIRPWSGESGLLAAGLPERHPPAPATHLRRHARRRDGPPTRKLRGESSYRRCSGRTRRAAARTWRAARQPVQCGYEHAGIHGRQFVEDPRDQGLEQRAVEVESAQQRVQRQSAGEAPGVPERPALENSPRHLHMACSPPAHLRVGLKCDRGSGASSCHNREIGTSNTGGHGMSAIENMRRLLGDKRVLPVLLV